MLPSYVLDEIVRLRSYGWDWELVAGLIGRHFGVYLTPDYLREQLDLFLQLGNVSFFPK